MKLVVRENLLEIASPAKVNLFLELFGRRTDGFHEIETVMCSVALYDRLRFSPRQDSEIRLTANFGSQGNLPKEQDPIPTDGRNLICRSLELVRSMAQELGQAENCRGGINVHLQKNIPSAAGLGGASSNSAATLIAANFIWKLNWSAEQLANAASQLGSDIAFFLTGGTAICRGRGELVSPLNATSGIPIVIAKPADSLSTKTVFEQVKPTSQTHDSSTLTQLVQNGSVGAIGRHLFNRLQEFAQPLTDQISILQGEFEKLNCLGHQMSGSGSSYFGVFENATTARLAAASLSSRLPSAKIFCTCTTPETRRPSWRLQGESAWR